VILGAFDQQIANSFWESSQHRLRYNKKSFLDHVAVQDHYDGIGDTCSLFDPVTVLKLAGYASYS
jgi:hypothetical protein